MSIFWRTVFFSRCTNTHHKLALDALRFLRGPQADVWANLFLANHELYLTGSKAPDNEFKDFRNHVLHVNDGFWGGATVAAREWYQKTVAALTQGDWPDAVYNAGVLSHYFTDPFQPFHTGQTEAEGKVHRAAEWSICKSYEDLQAILEHDLSGYPAYELPSQPDWLEEAIRQGALTANQSYTVCVDHYDLNRGIKDPPSGLDQELKDRLAKLIGLAAVGYSRVLERAFEESGASPPDVAVSLHVLLAGLKMPVNWIRKKFTDLHERALIEAIYLEVQDRGKVIDALPDDERIVRKQYAQEVLKVPVRQLDEEPAGATGAKYGEGAPSRGATVKPSSSASFQRTVVSTPGVMPAPRGPAAPLESCLMVPLAKAPPPDIVADVAARAYLLSQQTPEQKIAEKQAAQQPAVTPSATDRERSPAPASQVVAAPTSPTSSAPRRRIAEPRIAEPPPLSSSELEKEERRLQQKLNRTVDPEPPLVPPNPVMIPENNSRRSLLPEEMPVEMFAPLPPMPRVNARDATVTPQLTPPQPTPPQPTAVRKEQTAAAPTPVAATKPSAPAPAARVQPTAAPVAPQLPPGTTNHPRDARTYSAQPAEQSVVPAPHVRMPEPTAEQSSSIESKSRQSNAGQAAGFDFRQFSGATAPAPQPSPPQPVVTPAPKIAPQATAPRMPATQPATQPSQQQSSPQAVSQPQAAAAAPPLAARRFYLDLPHPIVDAPSIGPKTAERLQAIGLNTVADLLKADPGDAAEMLGNRAATDLVRDWQDQARLVCCIPNLRGHDAQFLVACQVRNAEQLRARDPRQLLQQVQAFLQTTAGQRLLRGGTPPDLTEVTEWVVAARDARAI